KELLPASALFTMAFRYNAGRALMMGARPGGRVPLWVQRMRGAESYARAIAYPDHPLLVETMRECLEDYLDMPALAEVLRDLASGRVRWIERRLETPSPMSLQLRRAAESELMYEYMPTPSGAAQLSVDMADAPIAIEPDRAFIEQAGARRSDPADADQLHSLMMIEGDLTAGELGAPYAWFERLAAAGRALYIEPGLWIAAEQQQLYDAALQAGERDAKLRIARRAARFRGPATAGWLAERYGWDDEEAAQLLRELAQGGALIELGGEYTHRDVFERAQRMTLSARRREAATVPAGRYAALLIKWQRVDDSPREQLRAAVECLAGLPLPQNLWEEVVFPARVAHYRPKMLDELLARGDAAWRLIPGERRALQFDLPPDIDWEADAPLPPAQLSEPARRVLHVLSRRGASFAHALSAALGGEPVADALTELTALGLARCDGFAPVRLLDAGRPLSARRRVGGRLLAQDAGRWDLARPAALPSIDGQLDRLFTRWAIACRETAALEDVDWRACLNRLRAMEFTGEARRGYFVKGLSGAQFVRGRDYLRVTSLLAEPSAAPDEGCEAICAADPMQAWGRILKLPEGAAFLCVPGTVVVTRGGEPALVLERQGASIRALGDDAEGLAACCAAAADAFRKERIYPTLRTLTVRQYSQDIAPHLEAAGFVREMRDYVLWKS
ncbi:MAG: DEAD/DEAH box helicase, partial [Clostridiales bacterium]|nr:DEAD/DEAH box helicase [Clostridiales bacterium]